MDRNDKLNIERFKVFKAICRAGDKWSIKQIADKTGLDCSTVYRHWVWIEKQGNKKKMECVGGFL